MVQNIAILGAVLVSAMGAIFGLYQARKADKSASTTKTIELGVKDLVDQYRETNEELRDQSHDCEERCTKLETKVATLERKVNNLEFLVEDKDMEIIRLKIKLGEPII